MVRASAMLFIYKGSNVLDLTSNTHSSTELVADCFPHKVRLKLSTESSQVQCEQKGEGDVWANSLVAQER